MSKTAVIIGAGPAGLTAAFELLSRSDLKVVVLEKSTYMGGISRTVNYKGNRIDIGGHRFFSKSDRVMDWWLQHMPLERNASGESIQYQNQKREIPASAASTSSSDEGVMLLRGRKSRIYFLRRFFEYPITLNGQTLKNLGFLRTMKIGFSYLRIAMFPPRKVDNLEEFFISRFGRELYLTFFKSYTEKVWGVPCQDISAEWGAQRVKGLSIMKTIAHMVKKIFQSEADIKQKDTETSLIEQFMYPKLGPGQLWEIVAEKVKNMGGEIVTEFNVEKLHVSGQKITSVEGRTAEGAPLKFAGDYFFSTMPVKELINALDCPVPSEVRMISDGLQYRDFITVGLLVNKLSVRDDSTPNGLVKDNWIYIQEPDVTVGRLQIFNNWSPYLVKDPNTVWIGCEYFCYDTDPLWKLPDAEMAALAKQELEKIGILKQDDVLDATVIRMEKTYPAYFGTYDRFPEIRAFTDGLENMFLVGRNGMHKYNNQDHSMLTAMTAVDNILSGRTDKENIWAVNTEMEYHEEKLEDSTVAEAKAVTAS